MGGEEPYNPCSIYLFWQVDVEGWGGGRGKEAPNLSEFEEKRGWREEGLVEIGRASCRERV